MHVKILDLSNLPEIERVFHSGRAAMLERNLKKNKPSMTDEDVAPLVEMMFSAMKTRYLAEHDNEHFILGVFEKDSLLAYLGIKFNLPIEFSDSWIVAWAKGDPSINLVTSGALRLLWKEMFAFCERRGKTRWFQVSEKKRYQGWDAFSRKIVPEIDSRYDWYDVCEIPPGEVPSEDWIYSAVGRTVNNYETIIVRAGVLKNEYYQQVSGIAYR